MSDSDVAIVVAVRINGGGEGSISLTNHGQVSIDTCCDTINDLTDEEIVELVGLLVRAREIRRGAQ